MHVGRYAEFTENEAKALIGKVVEIARPYHDLARGTRGRVLNVNLETPQSTRGWKLWRILVEWELPNSPARPIDWLAKWEYEEFLQVVGE